MKIKKKDEIEKFIKYFIEAGFELKCKENDKVFLERDNYLIKIADEITEFRITTYVYTYDDFVFEKDSDAETIYNYWTKVK